MKKVISTVLALMMLVSCVSIGLSVSAANICDVMGHSYGEWTISQMPSCNSNGLKTRTCEYCHDMQSQVLPMDPEYHASKTPLRSNGDGTHTMVCNGCGKEISSPCIAVTWTHNDETGKDESACVICSYAMTADCVIKLKPSATPGKHAYVCDNCKNFTEEACTFVPGKPVNATCEKDGTITFTCSKCGSSYKETFAPATGHTDANSDGVCDTCSAQLTAPKEESKSFLDTIKEFFQKILDWFKSLFK